MKKQRTKILITLLFISIFNNVAFSQVEKAQNKREMASQTLNEALRNYIKGDLAKAKEGLQLAISQDPSFPHPRYNLAVIAAAEEDWAGAIRWLEEFLKLDQTSERAEKAKSELEDLRQILEMDKTPEGKKRRQYEAAISNTSWLLNMGLLKEAVAQAAEAVKINPSGWEPYALTASALAKSEKWDDAKRFLDIAIKQAPAETKVKLKLTYDQIEKERQYKSFSDAANELLKKGDYRGAATQFKNAWQLFPDQVELGLSAALALWMANDRKAANEILGTLEKNPDPTIAEKVKEIKIKLNSIK